MSRCIPPLYQTDYALTDCQVGVVHLGLGAFHRAHQAVVFDDYMQKTGDLRWGIAALNLRPQDSQQFASLAKAKAPYILKCDAPSGESQYRLVRSHIQFVDWAQHPSDAEALLACPTVKILSMTVTESGYLLNNQATLDLAAPLLKQELANTCQQSVYAYLRAALKRRMHSLNAPLTILSCDNIRANGDRLKQCLLQYLSLFEETDLAHWVNEHVSFPNAMVDRITPRASAAFEAEVDAHYGAQSTPPVHSEHFLQWVLEANFASDFPELTSVGATFVKDVTPYEETKIRVLNGGHTCLAYLAALEGLETFDQAMAHPKLKHHFLQYEEHEVLPALPKPLPFEPADYLETVASRFCNPAIADAVERICADGYAKFPIFIRPTLEARFRQQQLPIYGLTSIASWYVFMRHVAAKRLALRYQEPYWPSLQPLIADGAVDEFCHSSALWGELPEKYPEFSIHLRQQIQALETLWPV